MARFRGTLTGERGQSSKLGKGHLNASINGWNDGIEVHLYGGPDGKDHARITVTGGSTGNKPPVTVFDGPLDIAAASMLRLLERQP